MLFVQMLLESEWEAPKTEVNPCLEQPMPAKSTGDSTVGWLEKWFPLPGAPER